jgi:hypothetical protein
MKSILVTAVFVFCSCVTITAQSVGLAAHVLAQVPYKQETSFQIGQSTYRVEPTDKICTGFRLEGSFYFPQKFVWSIGFTYMAPHSDSVVIEAHRINNPNEVMRTMEKTRIWTGGMRFGIAIPHNWDPAFSIMLGAGIQGGSFRQQYLFPESTPNGTTAADYWTTDFEKRKQPYMAGEGCVMFFYDFNRISASIQYSAFLAFDEDIRPFSRHGANIGIHIPIVQ